MIRDHKVFDCVIFFNEVDLLKIRLNILDKFVDYFVICESNYDHRGKHKKLNFDIKNFKKFEKKIIYVILEKFPEKLNAWQRQDYQRDFLINGLNKADSNDIILFSDVDEIPNLEINIDKIIKNLDKIGIFNQKVFYFKLNLRVMDYKTWEGTKILLKKNLQSFSWLRSNVKLKNLKYNFWRIDKFKKIYEINEKTKIDWFGRYSEDSYFEGNPWIICTVAKLTFEYKYKLKNKLYVINQFNLIEKYLENLNDYPEQICKNTGESKSALFLTWNYVEILRFLYLIF